MRSAADSLGNSNQPSVFDSNQMVERPAKGLGLCLEVLYILIEH